MYASVGDVKAAADTRGDEWNGVIQQAINAAVEAINSYCNRPDGFVATSPTPRLFSGSGQCSLLIGDCIAVTAVERLNGSQWVTLSADVYAPFAGDPKRPQWNFLPYQRLMLVDGMFVMPSNPRPNWRVTARWGYSSTPPEAVRQATITQAARWWKRGQSNWADTIGNADIGLLAYRRELDPDVKMMLTRLCRAVV